MFIIILYVFINTFIYYLSKFDIQIIQQKYYYVLIQDFYILLFQKIQKIVK